MSRRVLAVVAIAVAVAGCRRPKPPPIPELERTAAEETTAPSASPPAVASPAHPASAGSPPPSAPAAALPKSPLPPGGDVDPPPADRRALGVAVPEGLHPVQKSSGSELFRSPYTMDSLKRFFQRELGRDARIEPRAYGFKVDLPGGGFVMATQRGKEEPLVAVIRPVRTATVPPPSGSGLEAAGPPQ